MKKVCLYASGLAVLISLILQIVSSASYPGQGAPADYDKQKLMTQSQQWSVILMLLAIALAALAFYIPRGMPDL